MITRFAPSPTGPLHLGHAYSAILAHDMAMDAGGTFLLRIEDIDQSRARPEWETAIYNDLKWLGLWWPEPVVRQSERQDEYQSALRSLWERALLYPCSCTRKDIAAATTAPQEGAPLLGADGPIYPGTCRGSANGIPTSLTPFPRDQALRLDISQAAMSVGQHRITGMDQWQWRLSYRETGKSGLETLVEFDPNTLTTTVGDVVLARRDMGTSYHLSFVLDDAAQGVTDVVRGADLEEATPIHVFLQDLLDLPTPRYHHHKLIRDDAGKRLAKRDDARAISKYRTEGATPNDIRRLVGLPEV